MIRPEIRARALAVLGSMDEPDSCIRFGRARLLHPLREDRLGQQS